MSENRCLRCNRKLSDPNARYGWRCAEIMQKEGLLNYAGDNSFDAFMDGIRLADEFLLKHGIDPGKIDLSAFYQASIKCLLAEGMGNEELVEQALAEAEQALSPQRDAQGNPISTPRLPLEEYIRLRDNFDYQNGSFTTDRYLGDTPSAQILAAQELLNSLGAVNRFGDSLKADGLFGPNTQWALDGAMIKGSVPSLSYIRPIPKTMFIRPDQSGANSMIMDVGKTKIFNKGNPVFRFDVPEDAAKGKNAILGYHINTVGYKNVQNSNLNRVQKWTLNKLNHMEIPKPLYDMFHNFDDVASKAKLGGKAMAVVGVAMDIYDMGATIYDDLNDEDGKLGKKTVSAAVGIGSSWAGGAAGAKLGAMGGSALGTLICPGLGTVIGGFLGGLVGGIAGSWGARTLGEYIVDETYKGG